MITKKWDDIFLDLARWAAQHSKDTSTKVGAVLVSGFDQRVNVWAFNGFPPGVEDTPERIADRETKYKLTIHAERNVLDFARFDTKGATLYTTQMPCSDCAKSIISKGIARVVGTAVPPERDHAQFAWRKDAEFAKEILREAGVEVEEV